ALDLFEFLEFRYRHLKFRSSRSRRCRGGIPAAENQQAGRRREGARPPVKREYKAIFFEVKGFPGTEAESLGCLPRSRSPRGGCFRHSAQTLYVQRPKPFQLAFELFNARR